MKYTVALDYGHGLWSWSLFDDTGELVHSDPATYNTAETALALALLYLKAERMPV